MKGLNYQLLNFKTFGFITASMLIESVSFADTKQVVQSNRINT